MYNLFIISDGVTYNCFNNLPPMVCDNFFVLYFAFIMAISKKNLNQNVPNKIIS